MITRCTVLKLLFSAIKNAFFLNVRSWEIQRKDGSMMQVVIKFGADTAQIPETLGARIVRRSLACGQMTSLDNFLEMEIHSMIPFSHPSALLEVVPLEGVVVEEVVVLQV